MALLGGATGIAFAPILVRLSELPPGATAFWRLALSLPVLWGWQLARRRGRPDAARLETPDTAARQRSLPPGGGRRPLLILAGLLFAGDLALWHWSVTCTSVANATLLANCAPLVVTLGGRVLFGERVTRLFLVGLALALVGAVLLIGQDLQLHGRALLGDALGLGTAVFYGSYLLAVSRLRSSVPVARLMAWTASASTVALLGVTLLSGERLLAGTLEGWAVLAALALVSHVGGQGLIAFALAHLRASLSSVGLLLQPVLAAFLAWILFAEGLGPVQLAGACVVLAGILLARRAS